MRNEVTITIAIVAILLASGALISLNSDKIFDYDVEFSENNGEVSFDFITNTGSENRAVMFSNLGHYNVRDVVALRDDGYASLTDTFLQDEMLEDLPTFFSQLSEMRMQVCDARGVLDALDALDPSTTAVMIITGSIPDILYDGTGNSPLVKWLHSGGVLINISGTLGKYVSTGPEKDDIQTIKGFGKLFGEVDDEVFMDLDKRCFTNRECNEDIRDSLNVYMNEYTYGTKVDGFPEALNLGYITDDGISCASAFRSEDGMVMNFGTSIVNHVHFDYNLVKILAAGIDYTSELLDSFYGKGECGGSFTVPDGHFTVYAFIGSPRALYAEVYRY